MAAVARDIRDSGHSVDAGCVFFYVRSGVYYSDGTNFLEGGTHGGGCVWVMRAMVSTCFNKQRMTEFCATKGKLVRLFGGRWPLSTITIVRAHVPRFLFYHLHYTWLSGLGGLLAAAVVNDAAVRLVAAGCTGGWSLLRLASCWDIS